MVEEGEGEGEEEEEKEEEEEGHQPPPNILTVRGKSAKYGKTTSSLISSVGVFFFLEELLCLAFPPPCSQFHARYF